MTTVNWLRSQCLRFVLTEKWLVCHKTSIGQIWKDRINLSGVPSVNLHSKTIASIATAIAADKLCRDGISVLSRSKSIAIVQDILVETISRKRLTYFHEIAHIESLAKLVQRSIHDLRMTAISPDQLSTSTIHPHSKAEDLKLIYAAYCAKLDDHRLADLATCIQLATEQISSQEYALPNGLIILLPNTLELSTKEQEFLSFLAERSQVLRYDDTHARENVREAILQRAGQRPESFTYKTAHGEVNEIRHAVQQILGNDTRQAVRLDDVEFAYTNSSYAPLIYEFLTGMIERLRQAGLTTDKDSACPVTFSEGLPSVYARPGRALRAWMRWIRTDFGQSKAVQIIREGLLQRPESTEEIGYARLASNLRAISIGFERDRYLPQIQSSIRTAELLQAEYQKQQQQNPDEIDSDRQRDYGLSALRTLQSMFSLVFQITPNDTDSPAQILAKAKRFLLQCARCETKVDREARNKLLDSIDAKIQSLELVTESCSSILTWLEELPLETAILVSGPQPGRIHASRISDSGFTGRKQLFVLGLDAGRFPRPASVDPVLLDADRRRISSQLPTSFERSRVEQQSLYDLIVRMLEIPDASLHFSYSSCDLIEDRSISPSPALVELFRITQNNLKAHVDDLVNFIGPAVSFAGLDRYEWLDRGECQLVQLLASDSLEFKQQSLVKHHPHFEFSLLADAQRARPEFTEFDGLALQAGKDLDPTNSESISSPSRLETFGTCPRKFFFRYCLGAKPPDEWSIDPQLWLNPLVVGSLVHELFEEFIRDLTAQGLIPNLNRDRQKLNELLHAKLSVLEKSYPCQNQDAKVRQIEQLESMCFIFLREEQKYCESTGAKPWVLEASFGLDDDPQSPLDCIEPIELTLSDGRSIRAVGRIDRIDRVHTEIGASYTIWDYKSGSDSSYTFDDPFMHGRKLQSFLYVNMLRHRLAASEETKQIVFGYFFPNPATQGNRIQWSMAELKYGDSVLQAICNTIAAGLFPATTDEKDCSFCEYTNVCGDAKLVALEAKRLANEPINQKLMQHWRQLRELNPAGAES